MIRLCAFIRCYSASWENVTVENGRLGIVGVLVNYVRKNMVHFLRSNERWEASGGSLTGDP